MGNLIAYCFKSESILSKEDAASQEPKPVFSWDKRDEVDPADYCFDDLTGETKGKFPGDINGQQFSIENCKDCILFVFDNVASLTVDECTNCVIFIGPSKGSVFIRECTDVKLAVCCQQFRSRDCKRVDTFLHCNTQPIIESSTGMKFACLQFNYLQLATQVRAAGISLYNNEWNNIYDFSPVDHGLNFSILPSTARFDSYLTQDMVTSAVYDDHCTVPFTCQESLLPLIVASTDRDSGNPFLLSIFLGPNDGNSEVDVVLRHIQSKECRLKRSKETRMNTDTVIRIYGDSSDKDNLIKLAKEGAVIGFEVDGNVKLFQSTLPALHKVVLNISNESSSAKDINNFFNYVDMTMST